MKLGQNAQLTRYGGHFDPNDIKIVQKLWMFILIAYFSLCPIFLYQTLLRHVEIKSKKDRFVQYGK